MSFFDGRLRFLTLRLDFSILEISEECFMRLLSSLVVLKVSFLLG